MDHDLAQCDCRFRWCIMATSEEYPVYKLTHDRRELTLRDAYDCFSGCIRVLTKRDVCTELGLCR